MICNYTEKFKDLKNALTMRVGQIPLRERGFIIALGASRLFPVLENCCTESDGVNVFILRNILNNIIDLYIDVNKHSVDLLLSWREQLDKMNFEGEDHLFGPTVIDICILIDLSADVLQQIAQCAHISKFGTDGVLSLLDAIVKFVGIREMKVTDPGNINSEFTELYFGNILNAVDFQLELSVIFEIIDEIIKSYSNNEKVNYLKIISGMKKYPPLLLER